MLLRAVRWGLAGVLVAWTILRLFGLDRGWPLVPLFAFTPWVAGLALVGAVAAAVFGRKLFALVVSVASNKGRFQGGRGIEGIGVVPHELVAFDPADLTAKRDTLIMRAEALLAAFPQGKVRYDPAKAGWAAKK